MTLLLPGPLPPLIGRYVEGRVIEPITIGESSASVFRLSSATHPALILKSAPRSLETGGLSPLADEVARLNWLRGSAPVPLVIEYMETPTRDFLVMTALPGHDAASTPLPPRQVAVLLGRSLRHLHDLPAQGCTFLHDALTSLAAAKANLAADLVDQSDFNSANLGRDPRDLLAEAEACLPLNESLVLTHGDYCLPNILFHEGCLSGFIDLGRAGLGDPHRDLALAARSLQRNHDASLVSLFFDSYGLPEPDPDRLKFYELIDEFF